MRLVHDTGHQVLLITAWNAPDIFSSLNNKTQHSNKVLSDWQAHECWPIPVREIHTVNSFMGSYYIQFASMSIKTIILNVLENTFRKKFYPKNS